MRWLPSSPPIDVPSLPSVLACYPVVVIHFWAEWNGIERVFDERLREVQADFEGRVYLAFCELGSTENDRFALKSGVCNVPTLVCFINGEQVELLVGCRSVDELRKRFDGWLARASMTPDARRRAAPLRSVLLLWSALNGIAALPLIADPGARFKVFLNPLAPVFVVILEGLIVLLSGLRSRRQVGLGQGQEH